jgi:hypothetical protein
MAEPAFRYLMADSPDETHCDLGSRYESSPAWVTRGDVNSTKQSAVHIAADFTPKNASAVGLKTDSLQFPSCLLKRPLDRSFSIHRRRKTGISQHPLLRAALPAGKARKSA